MAYSIAAATIVALKRFTESLNTGFGHGELIRVHGQSQSYKLSDRSASTKDSRTSKPSVSVDRRLHKPEPLIASRGDDDFQPLNSGRENRNHKVSVSSLSKHAGAGESAGQNARPNDNVIRHDVRYSVHYDEEPLVTKPLQL